MLNLFDSVSLVTHACRNFVTIEKDDFTKFLAEYQASRRLFCNYYVTESNGLIVAVWRNSETRFGAPLDYRK